MTCVVPQARMKRPVSTKMQGGGYPLCKRLRATLGVIVYAIAGVAGWLSTPKVALLIFEGLRTE